MNRIRISYKLWSIGWLQWGKNINAITKDAEKELEDFKRNNPAIDTQSLMQEVKSGILKPV